jgi:phospholipid/cholesterol/gamma-HCH transport system substrate-binding protein/paraquat-inducible protein B
MNDKQQYYRLGLFVTVSLIIAFAILFILGGRSLFQPSLTFETYFKDSVAGLELGAPVSFRGVPLGQVTEIITSPALYEMDVPADQRKAYIVVRAKVTGPNTAIWKKELEIYVTRGLRVQTQMAGITGQQNLALDFFDPKENAPLPFEWKPRYAYVPSARSGISEIIATIKTIVSSLDKADIQKLGQNLNALVVNVNKKLDEIPVAQLAADADGLLKDARATVNRVDRVIALSQVEETLRNLSSASARVDKLLADPALQQTVANAGVISARLRKITETGELDALAKNLDQTILRVNAMIGENQHDIRGMIQDLRVTSDNLRTLSENIKRNPSGLLVGGPPQKVQMPKESK